MARRCVRPNGASDKAVPTAALRKQAVASDDQGHSGLPQLEASLARVSTSLSSDSHSAILNALRAYDRLVLKESHNIYVNQKKIWKHSTRSRKAS
jgi:hypothetical protein